MSTAATTHIGEVEVYGQMAGMIRHVVARCVQDISHEESLAQPAPQGNCINWVLGHLIRVYDNVLPLLGQEPLGGFERYDRGGAPLKNGNDAVEFGVLVQAWEKSSRRIEEGLAKVSADRLDEAAPSSPSNNPEEMVRSRLTRIFFHQSYHAGQLGLLRRFAGKPGVIG